MDPQIVTLKAIEQLKTLEQSKEIKYAIDALSMVLNLGGKIDSLTMIEMAEKLRKMDNDLTVEQHKNKNLTRMCANNAAEKTKWKALKRELYDAISILNEKVAEKDTIISILVKQIKNPT